MNYYDLRVQSVDEETVRLAERLGFSGMCFVNDFKDMKNYRNFLEKIKGFKTDLDILKGVYIKADNGKKMKRIISKTRNMSDVILVRGGDLKTNRLALEDPRVDVLTHPEFKRRDSGIDQVLARASRENYVAIELNFNEILNTFGKIRAHLLSHMSRNIKLAKKYNSPIIVTSGAKTPYELRGPKDLASLAHNLGIEMSDALKSVSETPEYIFKKNRRKVRSPWRGMEIL